MIACLDSEHSVELMDLLDGIGGGRLPLHARSRLYELIDQPSIQTWEDAFCIRLNPQTSLWAAVIEQGFTITWRLKPWRSVPTREQVLKALRAYSVPTASGTTS